MANDHYVPQAYPCARFLFGNAAGNGKLVTIIERMDSRLGRINYYISPELLCEQTGYARQGER